MNALRLLVSGNYWKYLFSIRKTTNAILGTLGIIWLLIESTSYFSNDISNFIKEHWFWLLLIALVWIIIENWPQTIFTYQLKNRDIKIQLVIADMFKCDGNIVVPINTSFDTSFDNDLISKNSTQGQFTLNYFKEPRFLDTDIQTALTGQQPLEMLPNKNIGNKFKYEVGKIIKLKVKNDKYAYLIAISDINDHGVAHTTFDNVLTCLASLWDFIVHKGDSGEILIPVLGTGRGRILETRETIIKAIVNSFIASTSNGKRFCDKLSIVIHPRDFKEHRIDINDLCDFLKLRCQHYEHDSRNKGIGQSIG
jgi:hypothetical protein